MFKTQEGQPTQEEVHFFCALSLIVSLSVSLAITQHILCAPAYIPTLHTNSYKPTHLHTTNPTNAPTPYIPILPLHTYPTYLHCPYQPTKPYIPTLSLHLHYSYNYYTLLCMPVLLLHTSSKSRQLHGAVAFCQ